MALAFVARLDFENLDQSSSERGGGQVRCFLDSVFPKLGPAAAWAHLATLGMVAIEDVVGEAVVRRKNTTPLNNPYFGNHLVIRGLGLAWGQ